MSFAPEHRTPVAVNPNGEPSGAEERVGDVDVLVVGAGPTGLTAACEAIRHGLSVRIVDRKAHRSTFSKALVVHARTLEVFETMGVAEATVAEGQPFAALNIHAGRRPRTVRVDLMELPWGDTAYPYWLSIPQYATERILEEHLNRLGGEVEWQVSLDELHEEGDHVEARLKRADDGEDVVRPRWVVGCDGGRSRVREQVGLHLDRADAKATFVLADVKTTADVIEDEGHVFLGPEGLLLIVPMPEPRRWRIIAHVPTPPSDTPITIDAAFLDALIRRRSGINFGSHDVAWQSQFNLRHGIADHYRRGRVFLAGDAAHVHSPVGGQGLNTGVQDAHNLLWKLGVSRRREVLGTEELLDSYEAERRPVAQAMVRGTARATGALTARSGLLRALLGPVAPRILSRPAVQARLGRAVGMLEIAYPVSPLANPAIASARAGRRMPNPELRTGGRLYQKLDPGHYTWVVRQRHGEAFPHPSAPTWGGLPVVFLGDGSLVDGSGPLPPVVLVRPDRYVAGSGDSVESVWSQLAVHPEQVPVPR